MVDDPSTHGLRDLLDREAIRDLLRRYARGVDRRDMGLVASCFTADAVYRGALGEGTIATVLGSLAGALRRYERTMHLIANQLVEIDGDRAASETYALAYHVRKTAGPEEMLTLAVRYLDVVVRDPEGWRIAQRTVVTEWKRLEALGDVG